MNKKLSTLMAISLMALSTSAFAADVLPIGSKATKVEGKKYFLIQNIQESLATDFAGATNGLDDQDRVLGMIKDVDHNTVSYVKAATPTSGKFATNGQESINNYLWTVSQAPIEGEANKYEYIFTNVATGEVLTVANNGTAPTALSPLLSDLASTGANLTRFIFGKDAVKYGEDGADFLFVKKWQKEAAAGASYPLGWTSENGWGIYYTTAEESGVVYELYEVTDEVVAGNDLNELYNAAGFNFQFVTKAYNGSIDNPFNNETLRAITLENDIEVDGAHFVFPKGTYFITDGPRSSFPADATAQLNYLLNCTFIAVSPSTNISTNKDKQNNGEGFQLTTVAGKDLNFLRADLPASTLATIADGKKPCGSTINVNNAAFSVYTNTVNSANQYALKLANFFYNKKDAKATDPQSKTPVYLNVASDASYSGQQGLVTLPGENNQFIFKFVESNVAKGTSFLSADGKSVYNITVWDVWGEAFHLGSLNNAGNPEFYAAGDAVADVDAPAYQFVVTDVDGNDVTLTNRASGETLTAKFFTQGDGLYTLAVKEIDGSAPKFNILDVNNQGDVVARGTQNFHQSWAALTPADAEEISGLDVEDGTKVTIAFARDNAPTSNKMYPVVTDNNNWNKLTDEVSEAAQWQLVKDIYGPDYVTRTYAYLDKDEKVAYKTKGDTIAYYTYNLQLVKDGNPVATYLNIAANGNVSLGTASDFVIKENVDGSVWISNVNTPKHYLSVTYPSTVYKDIDDELNRVPAVATVAPTYKATDIKTYLLQDAPEVSLPATSSFVTLKSEMGNYISMNEEKDGIVVNSDPLTFLVQATDLNAVVPSFFISTGWNEADGARDYLFNPVDSINYYVANGAYDKEYQWAEGMNKAIFKSGILSDDAKVLTTSIKGKVADVAMKADNKGTKGGLNRFKYQIVLAENEDDLYVIRQLGARQNGVTQYLSSVNDKLTWSDKGTALKFTIEDTTRPTANEAIAAEGVQVIGGQGVVTVQGAAGKVITVANILGQTIANQVAASDNVTIAAPAGVVVVAVDGEATKVVVK